MQLAMATRRLASSASSSLLLPKHPHPFLLPPHLSLASHLPHLLRVRRSPFSSFLAPSSLSPPNVFTRLVSPPSVAAGSVGPPQLAQRSYAKGKKMKVDEDPSIALDVFPKVKETVLTQMQAALDSLSRELSKLRSGRASAGMLDHVTVVDAQGVRSPLNHLAAVTVLDSQTLRVMPYDSALVKNVEKGIRSSPLQLNPGCEGNNLTVTIPKPTKEHIEMMSKLVGKAAETSKQSIRRARQTAMDSIKRAASSFSKDDVKRHEKEVEDITKKFVKCVDDTCKAKEKELIVL